jgi:FAD/FMN-containing dehydrogenase
MRVPPGVAQSDFAEALTRFETALGKQWVFTSEEDVDLYRDAFSPLWGEPEERVASAAVAPVRVEEVQEVVRIANRYRIPLYPISTGRNLGYGGSAPNYSGSVVVDLKRMNRVLDVNERNASALVEPGVSYFDLYQYIQERKLKVWLDVPDPGWGSPIGNSLDRGGGYTMSAFRMHFDAHCGMEVVLPNGEVMRTGMGALPGAKSWQEFKWSFGPWVDGLFSQSNFGIVTKMGFWLMPEPEAYMACDVSVPRHRDLIPLIDTLNYLENSTITNGMPDLTSPVMRMVATPNTPPITPELRQLIDKAIDGDPSGLDPEGQVLRPGAHRSAAVGVLQGALRQDSRRDVPRRRADPFSAHPGAEGQDLRRRGRHAGALHLGPDLAQRAEPDAAVRPPGLFTDRAALGRGDLRGEPHLCGGQAHARAAAAAVLHSVLFLAPLAGVHLPVPRDPRSEGEPEIARGHRAAGGGRSEGRLRRISRRARLPGPDHEDLFVQRQRAASLPRDAEGCRRSQRHPLTRTLRHLAEAPAGQVRLITT